MRFRATIFLLVLLVAHSVSASPKLLALSTGPTPPVITPSIVVNTNPVVVPVVNPIAKFKFTWTYVLHANSYEVWTNSDLTQPFMLWTNVGWTTNLTWSIPRSNMPPQMFFRIRGLVINSNNLKSVTLSWTKPSMDDTSYTYIKIYSTKISGVYTPKNEYHYAHSYTNSYVWPTNLITGLTYYFSASSILMTPPMNTNGVESIMSNETSYYVPVIQTNATWTVSIMQMIQ